MTAQRATGPSKSRPGSDRLASRRLPVPPLSRFVSRDFAARSPFWSWLLFERLGGALAYVFARLGATPAVVTGLGCVSGVLGAVLLGISSDVVDVVLAGTFLLLAYTLDCSDGQLARATHRSSAKGAWLDVSADAVVIAFVAASLSVALLGQDGAPLVSLLLAGAFGASRTASLFTSTKVRSDEGGMRLTGAAGRLRTLYTATIDTPFVYVVLCLTRLAPDPFRAVVVAVTVLTVVQTVVSARHHFASLADTTT